MNDSVIRIIYFSTLKDDLPMEQLERFRTIKRNFKSYSSQFSRGCYKLGVGYTYRDEHVAHTLLISSMSITSE